MNKIAIIDLANKLLQFEQASLGEDAIATDFLGAEKGVDSSITQGSIKAVFGANVAASISLLNSAGDIDADGIVGSRKANPTQPDFQPQLEWSRGEAWLKYALTAHVTASASAKLGTAAGSISGDRELRLLAYQHHDLPGRVGPAVRADLLELPSVLSLDDLLSLRVRSNATMKVRGKLAGQLVLTWSDIFSTSLRGLGALAGKAGGEAFAIAMPASASVTFGFSIEDDFTLSFTRIGNSGQAFQVAVRKSKQHDARFTAKAGITARLADPEAVRQILGTVMTGLLKVPTQALEAITNALSLERLDAAYRPYVDALAKHYGIDPANPFPAVKQKLQALDTTLSGRITELVNTKVELGVTYEYLRISSEASLLEATLSEAALSELHGPLLAFDMAKVLAYSGAGYQLQTFMHEKSIKRSSAWGFSLGIGHWLLLVRDLEEEVLIQRDYGIDDHKKSTYAYLGTRRYTQRSKTWPVDYGVEFKADLEDARSEDSIKGGDFQHGLQIWWQHDKYATGNEIDHVIDDAILWGIIDPQDSQDVASRIKLGLGAASSFSPRLSLMLGDQGFRQALELVSQTDDQTWCRHSARALPWGNASNGNVGIPGCALREAVFTPFFQAYLGWRFPTQQTVTSQLRAHVRSHGYPPMVATHAYNILVEADVGRGFKDPLKDFREGVVKMREVLAGVRPWRDTQRIFRKKLDTGFGQTFRLRTIASLLGEQLLGGPHDSDSCQATLTIHYRQGSEDRSLIVGGRS
ncbi:MAG TPA: hypothetical protein VM469_09240 [Pseudoxanthomonas sp.]|nr:hypothetical protein [Pseudoxanthomonas sp.]